MRRAPRAARGAQHLGLLSKGDVIVKTPADFIGAHLGHSERQTAAILEQAKGSVLVIDEAYGLVSAGGGAAGSAANAFGAAVIDTLVATVQGVPGDDRCVLLLGYSQQMEVMLREANPGLARRFQLSEAFTFADFSDDELCQVLRGKASAGGWQLPREALEAGIAVLAKERMRPNFGNGSAVANLLSAAVQRFEQRHAHLAPAARAALKALGAVDFDPSAGQVASLASIEALFSDLLGCDDVLCQLRTIHKTIALAQRLGKDPLDEVPLAYAFTGSPGTGKTTVARRMGTLFHRLGLLPSDDVKQHSASDFCTGFVGQAASKTRKLFEAALGGILFIDEAYRLHPKHSAGGGFMQEVVDEIVNLLTEPAFQGKMVVIFAGRAPRAAARAPPAHRQQRPPSSTRRQSCELIAPGPRCTRPPACARTSTPGTRTRWRRCSTPTRGYARASRAESTLPTLRWTTRARCWSRACAPRASS